MSNEHSFISPSALVDELVKQCSLALSNAVTLRGTASLLVSGGQSPLPFYQKLSMQDLPWQSIHIALVDERWVALDHKGSNEALVRSHLLINNAQYAQFIPMKNPSVTAQQGVAECENQYQKIQLPFDFIILGMGSDGHTASLFPKALGLEKALDPTGQACCAAITAIPSDTTSGLCERMTLTVPSLLNCRSLNLLITGTRKQTTLTQAKEGSDVMEMPIRSFLHQQKTPLHIYWTP